MKGRVKSIFAGVSISLGAFAYLITLQKTNNIFLSSCVFYIGLGLVLTYKLNLFTGKVFTLSKDDKIKYAQNLAKIFIYNLLGSVITTILLYQLYKPDVSNIINNKLELSWYAIIISAILCNFLVCSAIKLYLMFCNHIAPWFVISIFVLLGFNHVVADMTYFSIGFLNNINISIISTINYFILCTIGNVIGGLLVCYINNK